MLLASVLTIYFRKTDNRDIQFVLFHTDPFHLLQSFILNRRSVKLCIFVDTGILYILIYAERRTTQHFFLFTSLAAINRFVIPARYSTD